MLLSAGPFLPVIPLLSMLRGSASHHACRGQVWPYWAYSYAPDPFQPALTAQQVEAGITVARCPGFDNDTAHYLCVPPPHEWANCWKCPPKVLLCSVLDLEV